MYDRNKHDNMSKKYCSQKPFQSMDEGSNFILFISTSRLLDIFGKEDLS